MRLILASMCVLAAGCSGQALNSPTSPTPTARGSEAPLISGSTASHTGHGVPFRGSLSAQESVIVTFPTLRSEGQAEGTATHLGRYAATFNATVHLPDGTATGAYTFTAANGDELFSTFTGVGVPAGEGTASITETLTITGGTGRFAGATGTLVVKRTLDPNYHSSGSIEGSMTM